MRVYYVFELGTLAYSPLGRFASYYDAVDHANRTLPAGWSQDYRVGI